MMATRDPRVTPARPDLAAAHLHGTVDAARFVEGRPHRLAAPVTPLRHQPSPEQGIDTELLRGEGFTVYDTDAEGWSWGQADGDGYVGWLPSAALDHGSAPAPTLRVSVLRTFLYPGPSIKLPVVAMLPFGARVAPLVVEGAFARLDDGFVWAAHLRGIEEHNDDIVAVAETFLGTPYLWGGKSSLGLDCSALVQTALLACGHPAPRDSDMLERAIGTTIDPDGPMRRGDLVFWPGHVAMLADADTILHANGYTMTVALEDYAGARQRIAAAAGGQVTRASRL